MEDSMIKVEDLHPAMCRSVLHKKNSFLVPFKFLMSMLFLSGLMACEDGVATLIVEHRLFVEDVKEEFGPCGEYAYESVAPTATSDRECLPLKVCGEDEYESVAPTATTDRECRALNACGTDEYESVALTETTDRECTALSVCGEEEYESVAPTKATDRECTELSVCGEEEYASAAPTVTSDRECLVLTTCGSDEYESIVATSSSDRECSALYVCASDEWEIRAPGLTFDRICTIVTDCSPGEYESLAPTATSDRECVSLRYCSAEEYESLAATATTDRECTALTTCDADEYESIAATTTSDRTCSALYVCADDEWEASAPGPRSDRVCTIVSDCSPGEYESVAPTATSDRECRALTTCGAEEYESAAPRATSDRECLAQTTCTDEEYESLAATSTSDRTCSALYVCADDEWEVSAPGPRSDRVCTIVSDCSPGEYESVAPTATSDRECTVLRGCSTDEYESLAATATTDRECTELSVCGEDEYESAAPTLTQDRTCTSRQAVPGWVEAEDYGVGEAGLYYHDASLGNDGGAYRNDDVDIYAFGQEFFVSMQSSEWLRYPLSVAQSGTYRLNILAYAENLGRHLHVYVDGDAVALRAPVKTSGEDLVVDAVYLDAGAHVVQISGGIHDGVLLDAFELSLLDCPDMDADGQCDENDCRPMDAECFQGVCCRDLVGHWTFDEVLPGRTLDSSHYENHGSFTTSPLYIDGVLGNAMYFSGGEVVEIPNSDSLEVEKNYSFSAWVGVGESQVGKLLRLQNKTNAWVYLGENRFQVRAANTGSSSWPEYRARSSRPLTAQIWQHVAVVVDDTQVRIYIDGRLDVVKTIKDYGLVNANKVLTLAEGFVGALDDVRLYAETLSDDDIAELLMTVPGSKTACSDGMDNDNNAKKDFGLDADCASFFDNDESTDLTPPEAPINLSVIKETPIIIHLAWDKIAHENALGGYHIYRDDRRVDTVMRPAFYDTKLVEGERYRYSVSAIDAMGNESPLSQEISADVPFWPTRTPGETLVVSTTDFQGHDSLKALVESSPEDTTFVLEPGLYRLAGEIRPRTGQSLIGQPGAILSGAIELDVDVLQEEVVGEKVLYKWPNLNIKYRGGPGSCVWDEDNDPLIDKDHCLYTHDLFFNDVVLTRVMTKEEVTRGTFYTDYDGNSGNASVYFWDNPEGQKVELSKTQNAIMGGPGADCFDETTQISSCHDHVTIKGLIIEKFATLAQRGAIQPRYGNSRGDVGRYWRVEQNEIRWNHGLGVRLGAHSRLLNNNIHHNGNSGAEVGRHNLFEGNTFSAHNYAGYKKGWSAGAFKIVGTKYTLIRGNYAHDNDGHGMWTDIDNEHVVYENNISLRNNGDGYKHEISFDCVMRNNRSLNNYHKEGNSWLWGAGILIQNSEGCDVYNNHVEVGAQGNGITIIDQTRTFEFSNGVTKTFHGVGNTIHRNTVTHHFGGRSGTQNADNIFDYNVYVAANPFANHFGIPFHRFKERGFELSGAIFPLKEKKSFAALELVPSVEWVSNQEIFSVAGDSLLELEVSASVVGDDAITGVEFFVDDKLHAKVSHPPYVMRWFYPQEGNHALRAVVYTMHGESGKTAVKNLQIRD
jgi:hypothetical protein